MRLSLLTALAASIVIHATAARADVVTATNMDGGYVPTAYNLAIGLTLKGDEGFTVLTAAQEFIPTVSGTLTTLTAPLMRKSKLAPKPLLVSIFAKDAGVPGTPLGTLSVPYEDIDDSGVSEHTFDLASLNIDLVAGQSYFAVFAVEAVESSGSQYLVGRTELNANSFGIPPIYYRLNAVNGDPDAWLLAFATEEIGLIVSVSAVPPPQEVQIDVDPSSKKNRVNLKTKHPKPLYVAVLGDADLDVLDVLPETALLGDRAASAPGLDAGDPVAPTGYSYDDVDGDGYLDLLLQFDVAEMKAAGAIDGDSLLLLLTAELSSGGRIFGFDLINQKTNNGNGRGGR